MSEKILIVDDDPNVLDGYVRGLRKRFDLNVASSGQLALEMVEKQGPYAVVVADMRMPGMDGLEFLIRLRELAPETVRMMLTGNADQETAVNAVNQGQVFKFLNKPCARETMAEALRSGLDEFVHAKERRKRLESSVAEARDLAEKLSYQSKHDLLTGLLNRQAFADQLVPYLKSTRDEGKTHALCYLDINDFHVVNDTCGHVAGDEMLRQFGQLISSQMRDDDLVGRLFGDEFGLLLADCSLEDAKAIVERLHTVLKAFRFEWERERFDITLSIGLVPIDNHNSDATALLSAAETARSIARDAGLNQVHVSGPNDAELIKRLGDTRTVTQVKYALEEDRFQLYFQVIQPVVSDIETGAHYELLIRMLDEQGNILPPGEFLPAVEKYHLSPRLDCWVVSKAAEWLGNHPWHLDRLSLCSINLSGHSLGSSEVLEHIVSVFDRASVAPEKICLEITETAAIAQLSRAVPFIRNLKEKGFRFALDDFGSGFSSFAYLKNLPVDFLKIDGQFVKNMDASDVDRAMVKAIGEIGHVMGKKTIAEYVENERTLVYLREFGIDYAQGYYISRPRPLEELD